MLLNLRSWEVEEGKKERKKGGKNLKRRTVLLFDSDYGQLGLRESYNCRVQICLIREPVVGEGSSCKQG